MQRKKRRFSISYVLIPVCLVVAGLYLLMIGPELWKDNPTHVDHEAQQFQSKMEMAKAAGDEAQSGRNYELAFHLYREAIQIRPKNSLAFNDFGATLMEAAEAQLTPIDHVNLTEYAIDYDHNPLITLDYIKTSVRSIPTGKSGRFLFEVRKDVRNLTHEQADVWNKYGRRAIINDHPLRTEADGTTIYNVFLIHGDAAQLLTSAENRFRRAIELTPEYALAYRNLGGLLMLLHRSAESKLALRQALRLNPKDREVQRYLSSF